MITKTDISFDPETLPELPEISECVELYGPVSKFDFMSSFEEDVDRMIVHKPKQDHYTTGFRLYYKGTQVADVIVRQGRKLLDLCRTYELYADATNAKIRCHVEGSPMNAKQLAYNDEIAREEFHYQAGAEVIRQFEKQGIHPCEDMGCRLFSIIFHLRHERENCRQSNANVPKLKSPMERPR